MGTEWVSYILSGAHVHIFNNIFAFAYIQKPSLARRKERGRRRRRAKALLQSKSSSRRLQTQRCGPRFITARRHRSPTQTAMVSDSPSSEGRHGHCSKLCCRSARVRTMFIPVTRIANVLSGHLDPLLNVLSSAVLRSAWVEPDTIVRAAMWQPLLMFLKGLFTLMLCLNYRLSLCRSPQRVGS